MIKEANAFTGLLAVMVAAGFIGGSIVQSGELLAQAAQKRKEGPPTGPLDRQKSRHKIRRARWRRSTEARSGQVLLRLHRATRDGDRLQLVSERASGWIEAHERRSDRRGRRLLHTGDPRQTH